MRISICALLSVLLLSAMPAMAQTPRDLLSAPSPTSVVADMPVGLADAQSFEAPLVSEIDDGEIADARREMASAVSAEKFLDGAATVLAGAILLAVMF